MYKLLSAHVLALIDDSVISIERYIVVQCWCSPPCLPSSDPVSQYGDLYYADIGLLCTSLTKCLLLGIRVTTMDKDIYYSLWQWQRNLIFFSLRAEKYKFGKEDVIVVRMVEGMFYSLTNLKNGDTIKRTENWLWNWNILAIWLSISTDQQCWHISFL